MVRTLVSAMVVSLAISGNVARAADTGVCQPCGIVHRLSPEEAEAVQDAAAKRNIDALLFEDQRVPDGRIHGEIGFGIGTGGYSSVFGTAIVPLGEDGTAAFSLGRTNFGRHGYRH